MGAIPCLVLPGIPPELTRTLSEQVRLQGHGRLALVGGAVRDALLHQLHGASWRGLLDLDLVLEEPFSAVALGLQQRLGTERVSWLQLHERFGTAELRLDGVLIDLAGARQERYSAPGENPIVQPGPLEEDLARRDFSVNAMALVLQGDGSQQLLDPHGGLDHLASRQLVFLHEASVADDPTRVIRGARYGARLGFDLDSGSLQQLRVTVERWPWGWRHGDAVDGVPPALGTRLRMELDLLLEREPWPQALTLLQDWSALPLLDPLLQSEVKLTRRLRRAARLQLPLLSALIAAAGEPVALAQRLQIPIQQLRWLEQLQELRHWLEQEVLPQPWRQWGAREWTARLEQANWPAPVVALAAVEAPPCWRPLLRWWGRWRHATASVSAKDLIAQGLQPGPLLGEALRRSRDQVLEGLR